MTKFTQRPEDYEATEAAKVVGGNLTKPHFCGARGDQENNFNDLHWKPCVPTLKGLCLLPTSWYPVTTEMPVVPALDTNLDGNGAGANTWPAPTPRPSALSHVAPFDLDLLPEALRDWVMDIAERMQCPPDFMADQGAACGAGLHAQGQ